MATKQTKGKGASKGAPGAVAASIEGLLRTAGKPEGFSIAQRIVRAVEDGKTPEPGDMRSLADALVAMIDTSHDTPEERMAAFYAAMGMRGRQGGNREPTAAQVEHRVETVARVLIASEIAGLRKAKAAMLREMESQDPDGRSKRATLDRWIRDHRAEAVEMLRIPAFRASLSRIE